MTDNSLHDVLQLLNQNRQIAQNALKNAKQELNMQEEALANLEGKIRLKEDHVQILQQSVRTENEKYYLIVKKCKEKEALRVSLVQELCQVNFELEETLLKIKKVKASHAALEEKRQRHVEKVKAVEGDPENSSKLRCVRQELGILQEKKRRLDENEVLAKLIASGAALETVEAQNRSIQEEISKNWAVVNDMELELKDLEETSTNLRKQMADEEVVQQAELERLRRELEEVESEEEKLLQESEPGGWNAYNNNDYVDEMDSDTDLDMLLMEEPQQSQF